MVLTYLQVVSVKYCYREEPRLCEREKRILSQTLFVNIYYFALCSE